MAFLQRTMNRGSVSTGFNLDNSLLLEETDSGMNRNHQQMTVGGDDGWSAASNAGTNSKKLTVSLWFKRSALSTSASGSEYPVLWEFQSGGNKLKANLIGDKLKIYDDMQSANLATKRLFRDFSAWYHVVIAIDATQGTAANKVKIYVNGVQDTDLTDGAGSGSADYGNDAVLTAFNTTDVTICVGCDNNEDNTTFNGYIADFHFVDGAQKAATDFGEFDEDSGIWKPKEYTGGHGTLGCYYNFEDTSSNKFNDESGNGNDMNNRGDGFEGEITTDTPTNNFCTWNPLWNYSSYPKITEGATKVRIDDSTDEGAKATIGLTNGKWYWEAKPVGTIGSQYMGIQTDGDSNIYATANSMLNNYTMVINPTGRYYSYSGSLSESADQGWDFTTSDWLGVALDMESSTQTIKYYKNGSLIQSVNLISDMQDRTVFPFLINYENRSWDVNFGGHTINTISSAANDENGYGTFEYAPPSGYYAICGKNLAEFGGSA